MAEVKVMVDGGKATAAPPIGPALAPLGINVGQVVQQINEKTKAFAGMKVPVTILVGKDKSVTLEVGSPPTSALIKHTLNIQKGAKTPKTEVVANMSIEQLKIVIAQVFPKIGAKTNEAAAKEIAGSCQSLGITIDSLPAKAFIKAVNEGTYKSQLK